VKESLPLFRSDRTRTPFLILPPRDNGLEAADGTPGILPFCETGRADFFAESLVRPPVSRRRDYCVPLFRLKEKWPMSSQCDEPSPPFEVRGSSSVTPLDRSPALSSMLKDCARGTHCGSEMRVQRTSSMPTE